MNIAFFPSYYGAVQDNIHSFIIFLSCFFYWWFWFGQYFLHLLWYGFTNFCSHAKIEVAEKLNQYVRGLPEKIVKCIKSKYIGFKRLKPETYNNGFISQVTPLILSKIGIVAFALQRGLIWLWIATSSSSAKDDLKLPGNVDVCLNTFKKYLSKSTRGWEGFQATTK